jgi:uncharacterized protein
MSAPSGSSSPSQRAGHQAATSTAAKALLVVFRAYQGARFGRVSPCRFTPTCSQYAVEAVQRHGARRGLALALRRLSRCRPGGPFGLDPVPD